MLGPWELADAKNNLGIYTPDATGEGGSDLAAHSEGFSRRRRMCHQAPLLLPRKFGIQ